MSEGKLTIKDAYRNQLAKLSDDADAIVSNMISTDKITVLMANEAARNPWLFDCVKSSVGQASVREFFMLAARTGLEPGKDAKLLYATPRRTKGNQTILPIISYRGYCELAYRTGKVKRIAANPIYKDEVEQGLVRITKDPPDVQHSWGPGIDESDEGLVAYYALVEMHDGGKFLLVMSKEECIRHGKRGSAFNNGPWKTDFQAMCRKTVLKSLLDGGLVPLSSELRVAMASQSDFEDTSDPSSADIIDVPYEDAAAAEPEESAKGADALKQALAASKDEEVPGDGSADGEYNGEAGDESPFPPGENPFPDEPAVMA